LAKKKEQETSPSSEAQAKDGVQKLPKAGKSATVGGKNERAEIS